MGISACLIAKNEEENIGRCLESLKNAVDEIIVVDTGSSDTTKEIAKYYGAKVFDYEWDNNFSNARNFSLERANEPWILIIDCDEVLDQSTIGELKALTTDENYPFEGYGIVISNIIGGVEKYTVLSLRLIRNKKEYRFEGAIHEQVGHKIVNLHGKYSVLSSKIKFYHYGYEEIPELQEKKTKRNLMILESTKETNRDGLFYLHLGNEYSRMNNMNKAIECYKISLDISSVSEAHYTNVAHRLVEAFYMNNMFNEVIIYGEKILKIMPDFKAVIFLTAISHLQFKEYHKTLDLVEIYLSTENTLSKYPEITYDTIENIENLRNQLRNVCLRDN